MIIKSISLKNFKKFGNNTQTVKFKSNDCELILLSGDNGAGKCLSPDTEVEINVESNEIKKRLLIFLKNSKKPL